MRCHASPARRTITTNVDLAARATRPGIRGIRRPHRQIVSRAAACCGPHGDRIKRGAIEFLVLAVGEPNSATPRTQLRTHDIKLACKGIGFLESDLSVFEDHTALIFELFAYDEVKIEVGHTNRLSISIRKQIYHRAIGSPTETGRIQVYSCSCVAFPHSKKLSAPSRRSRRERGYKISVQWWSRILKDRHSRGYDND